MSTKNAFLFFLAVFGIIFMGIDACLPLWGLGNLAGAMSYIGALMIAIFLILVLGFGFMLKLAYIFLCCFAVGDACVSLFVEKDLIMGLVFGVASFLLSSFIPSIFLKKK